MSQIIPPRDTITITMHNLETPPRLQVDISRELPFPILTAIIGQALTALGQEAWARMTKPITPRNPLVEPPKDPLKASNGKS